MATRFLAEGTASRAPAKKGRMSLRPARENAAEVREGLRVLGVDPAVAGATGYGVIETAGAEPILLRFGALKLPASATFASRLREIHRVIAQLVDEFMPDAVAVESVFTALNMRTALKLAEIRGVVLLAAAQASIPAFSYSPREVKASVAGYGAASKQQMQQMVSSLLRLSTIPEPADAADALAVALCHAQLSQARERMAAAMGGSSAATVRGNAGRAGRVSNQV
ncbi:MAG TPA: crossover junction endodeoxyribonuclease RuvC [Candidatus Acidoferrales bacterium]|nr:crossover junction endodeoxyribonuclease RuvC [Candidatus Acidoferrales bacterium]